MQENGVGSVLSVILVAVNDISEIFHKDGNVRFLIPANDLAIYSSGAKINTATNNVQSANISYQIGQKLTVLNLQQQYTYARETLAKFNQCYLMETFWKL